MRVLVQRVHEAQVTVEGRLVGAIERGLLVFVCAMDDQTIDAQAWARRLCGLRVFADARGRMSLNVSDVGGSLLLVSQFTLSADTGKGLRPSFSTALPPAQAELLYDFTLQRLRSRHLDVAAGVFGADMQVSLTNDGPVTFLLES